MATPVRASQARPKAKSRLDDRDDAADGKPPESHRKGEDSAPQSKSQNITGVKRMSLEAQLDAEETILDPKVMVPYVTKVGDVPRRVQIERKKRLYATQSLPDLLVKDGLVPDQLDFDNKKLPLYLFDNTDFETRYPHQWVDKVTRVPAIAACAESDGKCEWKKCSVIDFLPDSNAYLVRWEDTETTSWLPRIQVHFLAEDPALFAKRVKQAHDERAKAELQLRYNLYITSMPVEDKTYLTSEQLARVIKFSCNTKAVKEKAPDLTGLLREVNSEFGCVMNKLVFDDSLRNKPTPSNEFVVDMDVQFPPQQGRKHVPQIGTVTTPEYDYEEQSSEFYFMSCLTRPEVIIATGKLRFECNKIPKLSLLSTHYTKSLRLDEFEAMEIQTSEQALQHLKESWLTLLRNIIRTSFKDAGKGWFNVKEESLEAYRASKMRRYLTMVRYVMEDALRYLVEETLEKYTIFIEKNCGGPLMEIVDIDEVNCVWPQQDFAAMVKKPPLFSLEVVTAEGGIFEYNTQIKNFEEVTVRMLEHALKLLQTIPQLEPSIMENQFWSKIPNLSAPQVKEPEIQIIRERVTAAIKKAMVVAQLYLDKFVEFEPLLKVDVAKYKAELTAKKLNLKELVEEIKNHKEEQDSLDRRPVTTTLKSS